ncbi:uncharacterized protein KIAA1614 homolog isoform X2 [Protopterus annectens]|uniref:uncharacterized protein KIAA1614 homolog isoform X2 n=1 Tax=Protopterus annectens TaxID=7888 RepID=UPI001CF9474A|nr:uncharacterized protein KIAA1614 homolog isoform X2 [Protopterus annectens]
MCLSSQTVSGVMTQKMEETPLPSAVKLRGQKPKTAKKKKAPPQRDDVSHLVRSPENKNATIMCGSPTTSPQHSSQTISSWQAKVKALKENTLATQLCPGERISASTNRQPMNTFSIKQSSEDVEVKPEDQLSTYPTDKYLNGVEEETERKHILYPESQCPLRSPCEPTDSKNATTQNRQCSAEKLFKNKGGTLGAFGSPKSGQRITGSLQSLDNILRDPPHNECYRTPVSGRQKTTERFAKQDLKMGLSRAESLESLGYSDSASTGNQSRMLWGADSWNSIGTSNASSLLSLAERIEMNKTLLKQMLSVTGPKHTEDERLSHESSSSSKKDILSVPDHTGKGTLPNDSDLDSGISLQESEGSRAFVSSEDLPLSPRHEQAKRLLERARMKARTHPLKADHTIQPLKQDSLGFQCTDVQDHKKITAFKDISGNLSDSSSGESSCGPHRKRGQSPTRVRFEDESAQEAEVRYLERTQQNKKETVEPTITHGFGLLLSKPDLTAYITSSLHRNEVDPQRAELINRLYDSTQMQRDGFSRKDADDRPSSLLGKTGSAKSLLYLVDANEQCRTHDSYNTSTNCNSGLGFEPPAYEFPGISILKHDKKNCNVLHEGKLPTQEEKPDLLQQETRVVPCWVLPSQHRIRTEPIKETYIGEVTAIDDIHSVAENAGVLEVCKKKNETHGVDMNSPIENLSNTYPYYRQHIDCHNGTFTERELENQLTSIKCNPHMEIEDMEKRNKYTKDAEGYTQYVKKQKKNPSETNNKFLECNNYNQEVCIVSSGEETSVTGVTGVLPLHTGAEVIIEYEDPSLGTIQMSGFPQNTFDQEVQNGSADCHEISHNQPRDSSPCLPLQYRSITPTPPPPLSSLQGDTKFSSPKKYHFLRKLGRQPQTQCKSNNQNIKVTSPLHLQNSTLPSDCSLGAHINSLPSETCSSVSSVSSYRAAHLGTESDISWNKNNNFMDKQVTKDEINSNESKTLKKHSRRPSQMLATASQFKSVLACEEHKQIRNGARSQNAEVYSNAKVLMLATDTCEKVNSSVFPGRIADRISLDQLHSSGTENYNDSVDSRVLSSSEGQNRGASKISGAEVVGSISVNSSRFHSQHFAKTIESPDIGSLNLPSHGSQELSYSQESIVETFIKNQEITRRSSPSRFSEDLHGEVKTQAEKKSREGRPSSGIKKFFAAIGQNTVNKFGRIRASSLEQIPTQSKNKGGEASLTDETSPKLKKAPSFQSLKLKVSPFSQLKKASSAQSLFSSKRTNDRSSLYMAGGAAESPSAERKTGVKPKRSLSVEDVGSPGLLRTLGRLVETFPDGTFQLELIRPPSGTFGIVICIGSGKGDKGVYVQRLVDQNIEKLYMGLLMVGDEILEINGTKVAGLTLQALNELMMQKDTLSLRVLRNIRIKR